ncbi:MAG: DUF2752 domain-containing protein [Acidobacteriota bacterium]
MEVDSAIPKQVSQGFEPPAAGPSKWLAVFALVGLFAVFLASVLFKASTGDYFTVCGFKNFTGLPCPGCGLTHSFCAIGKGDIIDGFAFNLLGPPLFLVLVLVWIRSACVLLNRSKVVQLLDQMARRFNLVRAFAIAFGVYGIVRITYLIAFRPLTFHDSPLSQLIARLIH